MRQRWRRRWSEVMIQWDMQKVRDLRSVQEWEWEWEWEWSWAPNRQNWGDAGHKRVRDNSAVNVAEVRVGRKRSGTGTADDSRPCPDARGTRCLGFDHLTPQAPLHALIRRSNAYEGAHHLLSIALARGLPCFGMNITHGMICRTCQCTRWLGSRGADSPQLHDVMIPPGRVTCLPR